MATRTLIAALFLGAVVAACAATDDPSLSAAQDDAIVKAVQAAQRCKKDDNGDDCSITVTVRDNEGGCLVEMEQDQKIVGFRRGERGKAIFWQLDDKTTSRNFIFTKHGIAIVDDTTPVFYDAQRFNLGKGFRWRNGNPGPGEFYYAVHVKNTNSSISCSLDPKIRNQS
ncbi:MAG: hypothetical protein ABI633_09745 [Burkholderiales bacterium]